MYFIVLRSATAAEKARKILSGYKISSTTGKSPLQRAAGSEFTRNTIPTRPAVCCRWAVLTVWRSETAVMPDDISRQCRHHLSKARFGASFGGKGTVRLRGKSRKVGAQAFA